MEYQINDSFSDYLKEINSYQLLSREQEIELSKNYQKGDLQAKEILINSNLRLVIGIAKKYNQWSNLKDLIQEGNAGLIRAVEKFNPDLGYKFSTYAQWHIKSRIRKYLNDNSQIRLPSYQAELKRRIERISDSFVQKEGREPTPVEIAEILNESERRKKDPKFYLPDQIECLLDIFYNTQTLASLDKELDKNSDRTLGDIFNPRKSSEISIALESEKRKAVYEFLSNLTEREKEVIEYRFGLKDDEPKTLEKIGRIYGVTRERIRQIEAKAMKKLRDSRSPKLAEFLFDE